MDKLVKSLEYCGCGYEILEIGDGWKIVVTDQGGHIFGPYNDHESEGIFWAPEETKNPEEFKKLVDEKIWNIGGDRIWIAPEIQFNITDRSHFRETLKQPKTMDPGDFTMNRCGDQVTLFQSLDLPSYNTVTGSMHFDFHRTIHKILNPLRKLPSYEDLMEGVSYCGFEQVLDLSVSSAQDMFAESWDLLQIRPKGTLYMPMYTPLKGTDHYEPAGDHEYFAGHGVCLKITGDSRYKIAYKAAALTGRFGYLKDSDTEDSYLIIINYPNNPSAMYSEEPPLVPGDTGYSIHIYNDDGNSGGFAEMECNMQTIGNPTGLTRSIDRLSKWIFVGKTEKLRKISDALLGYDFT